VKNKKEIIILKIFTPPKLKRTNTKKKNLITTKKQEPRTKEIKQKKSM